METERNNPLTQVELDRTFARQPMNATALADCTAEFGAILPPELAVGIFDHDHDRDGGETY